MKRNNYNLEFAKHELDCSFMQLMPGYLKDEVLAVIKKYKKYCTGLEIYADGEVKSYEITDDNYSSTFFDAIAFIDIWNEYSKYIWNSPKSKWMRPLEYFEKYEDKMISFGKSSNDPDREIKKEASLITDMAMSGASEEELSKEIKHSIDIIDGRKKKK